MNEVVYESPQLVSNAERNAGIIHDRMLRVVLRLHPGSLLEVGAGQGKLGAAFAANGIDYCGIEPVENEIEKAQQAYPGLRLIQASCYDDPEELRAEKFDVVYSNDIIEHLYEPRKLASFSRAHLRPGGRSFAARRTMAAMFAIFCCRWRTVGITTITLCGMAGTSSSFHERPCISFGRSWALATSSGERYARHGCR